MSALSEYVEFGLGSSYPGPFECRDGDMRMMLLDGDEGRIRSFVDRVYNEPAKGVVEYRPVLGKTVILMYGLNIVSSATPPWSGYGRVEEQLVALWVPVWAGHTEHGSFKARRFCMSLPHILVDNPISLLAGREIYGFPKALGRFEFEKPGERLLVKGYGGELAPDVVAAWHDLIEIRPLGGADLAAQEAAQEPEEGPESLVDAIAQEAFGESVGANALSLPSGIDLIQGLCKQVRSMTMEQLFLKQFRDAALHDHACYQAVVEAPAKTLRIKWRPSLQNWRFELHQLGSHPIGDHLGLTSQDVTWSAKLTDFDFDEYGGRVVAP